MSKEKRNSIKSTKKLFWLIKNTPILNLQKVVKLMRLDGTMMSGI